MTKLIARVVTLALFTTVTIGCEATKPGEACDGFFSNGCKSPLSCVDTGGKKVCAGSCSLVDSKDPKKPGLQQGCTDPNLEPAQVEYTKGGASIGGAGCYCLPKK